MNLFAYEGQQIALDFVTAQSRLPNRQIDAFLAQPLRYLNDLIKYDVVDLGSLVTEPKDIEYVGRQATVCARLTNRMEFVDSVVGNVNDDIPCILEHMCNFLPLQTSEDIKKAHMDLYSGMVLAAERANIDPQSDECTKIKDCINKRARLVQKRVPDYLLVA